jgi:hypothetical protein
MSAVIKLSNKIINDAKRYANVYNRSLPKQIEHWSQIGKIAEENPDLSYNLIRDILLAKAELTAGEVEEYTFSDE